MEKNYIDDELEIKFKEILEYYKSMYSPTENPKVTLLGGQPGAGIMETRKAPVKEISELKNEKEQILERIFKTKEKIKESPWKKKIEKDKSKGLGRG